MSLHSVHGVGVRYERSKSRPEFALRRRRNVHRQGSTLDGVIHGNTILAIAATNGRECTNRATGTSAIRGTR
jgi:hypothetical protein